MAQAYGDEGAIKQKDKYAHIKGLLSNNSAPLIKALYDKALEVHGDDLFDLRHDTMRREQSDTFSNLYYQVRDQEKNVAVLLMETLKPEHIMEILKSNYTPPNVKSNELLLERLNSRQLLDLLDEDVDEKTENTILKYALMNIDDVLDITPFQIPGFMDVEFELLNPNWDKTTNPIEEYELNILTTYEEGDYVEPPEEAKISLRFDDGYDLLYTNVIVKEEGERGLHNELVGTAEYDIVFEDGHQPYYKGKLVDEIECIDGPDKYIMTLDYNNGETEKLSWDNARLKLR